MMTQYVTLSHVKAGKYKNWNKILILDFRLVSLSGIGPCLTHRAQYLANPESTA